MEQENRSVNIESIMEIIRKEAEALRYEEPVSFEDVEVLTVSRENGKGEFDLKSFERTVGRANTLWEIPYGREITGNPLKKLTARAARKVNKPTGAPMARDITNFNAEVTQGLNGILLYFRTALKKEEELEHRIFELEEEIRRLKRNAGKKA